MLHCEREEYVNQSHMREKNIGYSGQINRKSSKSRSDGCDGDDNNENDDLWESERKCVRLRVSNTRERK